MTFISIGIQFVQVLFDSLRLQNIQRDALIDMRLVHNFHNGIFLIFSSNNMYHNNDNNNDNIEQGKVLK